MPKRQVFTNITPLPPTVTREFAISALQNHNEMITLNPMVLSHQSISAPQDAPADEFLEGAWYEITDQVSYLPGVKGKVTYRGCFHDIADGLQTHIYAPLGLDIKARWTVGGSLPGEPPEPREIGIQVPAIGLYIREDEDIRCSHMMAWFVRKNMDSSHKRLVEMIIQKATGPKVKTGTTGGPAAVKESQGPTEETPSGTFSDTLPFQKGSHMANSKFADLRNWGSASVLPRPLLQPLRTGPGPVPIRVSTAHPALRNGSISAYPLRDGISLDQHFDTVYARDEYHDDSRALLRQDYAAELDVTPPLHSTPFLDMHSLSLTRSIGDSISDGSQNHSIPPTTETHGSALRPSSDEFYTGSGRDYEDFYSLHQSESAPTSPVLPSGDNGNSTPVRQFRFE